MDSVVLPSFEQKRLKDGYPAHAKPDGSIYLRHGLLD